MNPERALQDLLRDLEHENIRIIDKTGFFWELVHYLVCIITFGGNKRFRNYCNTFGRWIGVVSLVLHARV